MAIDFEALITKHAGEDGSIPAASIAKAAAGISAAVGREFVAKVEPFGPYVFHFQISFCCMHLFQ